MGLLLGQVSKWRAQRANRGAHAARGFVGGAARENEEVGIHDSDVSMPHAALWVVQPRIVGLGRRRIFCFNAARGFVGGAAPRKGLLDMKFQSFNAARGFVGGAAVVSFYNNPNRLRFQCRTRLCGWCSRHHQRRQVSLDLGFNAARGFVGGAAQCVTHQAVSLGVSMPHAALWVVQRHYDRGRGSFRFVSMPHAALWVVQPRENARSSR